MVTAPGDGYTTVPLGEPPFCEDSPCEGRGQQSLGVGAQGHWDTPLPCDVALCGDEAPMEVGDTLGGRWRGQSRVPAGKGTPVTTQQPPSTPPGCQQDPTSPPKTPL